MKIQKLCVFCGAHQGRNPLYSLQAREFGRLLAEEGIQLVYGGGRVGLMGVVADAVLEAGGEVVGVIPEFLVEEEVAHEGVELKIVRSMHERKSLMAQLADGFVALPGGLGTLEELCEILTWSKLGLHQKPCGILNIDGYFQPLLDFFSQMNMEGFLRTEVLSLFEVSEDPSELLQRLQQFTTPYVPKLIDSSQI